MVALLPFFLELQARIDMQANLCGEPRTCKCHVWSVLAEPGRRPAADVKLLVALLQSAGH